MGLGWQEIDKTLDLCYIRVAGLHRECKPAVLFDPPNFRPRTMTHVRMYVCMHVHTYVCMCVCTYKHTYMCHMTSISDMHNYHMTIQGCIQDSGLGGGKLRFLKS